METHEDRAFRPFAPNLEFIRRIYLDLTGLPPSPKKIRAFVDDQRETARETRCVVRAVIGSSDYVDFWAINGRPAGNAQQILGSEALNRSGLDSQEVEKNTPLRSNLPARFSPRSGRLARTPGRRLLKIVRARPRRWRIRPSVSGTRFNCNQMHYPVRAAGTQDHTDPPAAYSRGSLKKTRAASKKVGGTMVESAKPFLKSWAMRRGRSEA